MTRFFFDVVGRSCAEYDLNGTFLADSEEAHKWARLLALALAIHDGEHDRVAERVGVRGSDGHELFSIPIRRLEMALPVAANSPAGGFRGINVACCNIVGSILKTMRARSPGVRRAVRCKSTAPCKR